MSGCIFCKIVAGKLPSCKLMEDKDVLAFVDIGPIRPGHALLIPKKHYERTVDMPGEEVARLMAHLPKLAKAIVQATGADGYNVLQMNGACAGQVVPHVHFHIIPRHNGDGVKFGWPAAKYPEGEMEKLGKKIRTHLQ
ncbi:MAG: HIT family protein [Planctomycetota bacterium]